MQNKTQESLNQAIEDEAGSASGAAGSAAPADTPEPASKKKASKKKASKKKASKKKASKKKASKKKASKKKASKKKASKKKASKKKSSKKRGKKKASRRTSAASPWERLALAAEHMRVAALELAEQEASQGRKAIDDFVGATRAKLTDLESVAERGIARITGK